MAISSFSHRVEYPDNKGITLTEIAETLLAHERVVQLLPLLLEKSVDGLKIEKIEIGLSEAEQGSLFEEFIVKIWTTYQSDIQKGVIDVVNAMSGQKVPDKYEPIVTLLILLLLLAGAVWIKKRFAEKRTDGVHIKGDYNNVLNITAETLNISPERLEEAVSEVIKGPQKRAIGKAAQRFFRPAQRNGNGRIKIPHFGEISKRTVSEIPTDIDIETADEQIEMEPLKGSKIYLRAYDLDRREHGWYGVVEKKDFRDHRMPISLYPTINPETLKGSTEITADVMIERHRDGDGEWYPRRIHVLEIHKKKSSRSGKKKGLRKAR